MKMVFKNIDFSSRLVYSMLRQQREEDMRMSLIDILLILAIAACIVLVVRKMVKDKKAGKSCCGCSGCSGGSCHCSPQEAVRHK